MNENREDPRWSDRFWESKSFYVAIIIVFIALFLISHLTSKSKSKEENLSPETLVPNIIEEAVVYEEPMSQDSSDIYDNPIQRKVSFHSTKKVVQFQK